MEKVVDGAPKMYTRPMVVGQQPIRFETTISGKKDKEDHED